MTQNTHTPSGSQAASGKPRLLDQMRRKIRFLHYSYETEKTHVFWIRYFILCMGNRHPAQMGARGVRSPLDRACVNGPLERGGVPVPAGRVEQAQAEYSVARSGFCQYNNPAGVGL